MVKVELFHYQPGSTLFHRLHPTVKIIWLFALSFLISRTGPVQLTASILVLLAIMLAAGLKPVRLMKGVKGMLGFILFIFLVQAGISLYAKGGLHQFSEHPGQLLLPAYMTAGKLLFFLLAGLSFTAVTSPGEIRKGIGVLLIPFGSAGRLISFMLSMTLTTIPLIIDRFEGVSRTLKVRAPNLKGVKRLSKLLPAVLYSVFLRADKIAWSMEARHYDFSRRLPSPAMRKQDWISLSVLLTAAGAALFL